ncbi:GTP cyclohydrolase I [Cellulomonas flavigena DSM 20109]|uniref:GTP cyclohydrolase 1 n=1 Tax=Cellulomonas flavigena (strain ATCC 482 / DSM 20109 / BCRC 11376 / JCM 18109 / NBRC 3775 / NCIMB 8073 / NRS 134) TaxID=446466 RepID=D5UIP1_CELFN|nr:GTP cyclohydrolase I [Cellulomonas flavigena DSM 20109]
MGDAPVGTPGTPPASTITRTQGHGGRAIAPFDEERAARAVRELLLAVGEDPDREGLQETPARVARAYREIFAGLTMDARDVLTTTFDLGHEEMVIVRDIEVYSTCEHHLVPFHGVAHVGYIPGADGRITGLSKLARLVDVYARRPQVQERLTSQVADALVEVLDPTGVLVVVECEHLCMSMRGVRKPGSRTVTSAVRGQMRDVATRAEAMSLLTAR